MVTREKEKEVRRPGKKAKEKEGEEREGIEALRIYYPAPARALALLASRPAPFLG